MQLQKHHIEDADMSLSYLGGALTCCLIQAMRNLALWQTWPAMHKARSQAEKCWLNRPLLLCRA